MPTSDNATWNAVEIVEGSTGYRLPTEAQWEYACRAGTTTPWYTASGTNNDLGAYAWYSPNGNNMTHEVGSKLANAFRLYDMHGNVHEWCWDWYAAYSSSAQTDPSGAASGNNRMRRGGSFYENDQAARSARRVQIYPYYKNTQLGFRLVRPQLGTGD